MSNNATGQALAAVGYNWTANIATTLGYRVLYTYDKQDTGGSGNFRYQQWIVRASAYGRFLAFSARSGLIGKDSKGSTWPVRRAVGERPVFAHSGRPVPT